MLPLLPSDIFQGTELKFTLMHCIPEVYLFRFLQKKPKPDAFNLCSCMCGWWFPDALIQDKACHVSKVQILPLGSFLSGHQLVRGQQHIYPIYSQLITRDQFDRWRTLKDVAKEQEKVTTSLNSFCTQGEVQIYADTEDVRSKREEALSSKYRSNSTKLSFALY